MMRFQITISKEGNRGFLPINYQYELSSAIYKTIDRANSEFSMFLHEHGYLAFGRSFRLFTFSRLSFDKYKVVKEAGRIEHLDIEASFEISFMVDQAAEEFVRGLFMNQVFVLGDRISRVDYVVSRIDAIARPQLRETMNYRCLSPIFLRRKRTDGGEDYLHPDDREYGLLLVQNLLSKANAFHHTGKIEDVEVSNFPPFDFRPIGKVYKNGVKIKQLTQQETMLIGYMFEFELTAPIELHEIGYYSGFGHLNSQGFGCVEVASLEDNQKK